MSKVKFCGLTRKEDVENANELLPEYVGFVFAKDSRRYISYQKASELKNLLDSRILAVGVFVDENIENIVELLNNQVIDIVQLHGNESEEYIKSLSCLTDKPIIKAFRIECADDVVPAQNSSADFVLLDAKNGGSGKSFDWDLIKNFTRDYFLAGGLNTQNIKKAIEILRPFAIDVSSGIETKGFKDKNKMSALLDIVRGKDMVK